MISMVITYVGLRNDYKGQMRCSYSEYTVPKRKFYHLSYPQMLCYINCYYEYKNHTKASLKANEHNTQTTGRIK
jgi:hypothetical protein